MEANRKESAYIYPNYFLGSEEGSPFLKPTARRWGENTRLQAAILAVVLLAVAFALSFFPTYLSLSNLLLVGVYFLAGIPALIESIENISNFDVNIDVLMTLAAFSSVMIGSGMEGALLLVLFELSGALEETVTLKAKSAISNLHKLAPAQATVVEEGGRLLERSVRDIPIGAIILVQAGQVVPLDGKIIEGISSVNLVHLTGENLPVAKKKGEEVAAGARNLEAALTLQVIRSNVDSTLTRIIQLVTEAQEARPKLQRWFDKFSRSYALFIIFFSLGFALILPWMSSIDYLGYGGSFYRALAFLIAASPCALIIALPIAYLSAVSACARQGILLKGGVILDALARCKTIAFDKTGTLTTGILSLVSIEGEEGEKSSFFQEATTVAVTLERNVIHPIADALLDYAEKNNITPFPLHSFKSIAGLGIEGIIDTPKGKESAYIGKGDYIYSRLSPSKQAWLKNKVEEIQNRGELLAVLLLGEKIALFRFRDRPRFLVGEALTALKKESLKLVMLTGDHLTSAQVIAQELGIDQIYANLTPQDKLEYVTRLSKSEGLVMIGDGVNDAPALARATVGIGMGKVGSDTAIEASDVVFLHDNIEKLPWLMKKAKLTQRIVKENLILALTAILVATTPALLGEIPLWVAVVLHEGGTVIVGLNALRLLR